MNTEIERGKVIGFQDGLNYISDHGVQAAIDHLNNTIPVGQKTNISLTTYGWGCGFTDAILKNL